MRKRRYSLITEDHRTVIVRSNSVIYLTGVSVGSDHKVLQTYASSVRGLADHIDLVEIWALFHPERKTLTISDLATLYWEGEVDPSRWIALYLHLESVCPYFESDDNRTYVPLNDEEVDLRKRWISGRESQNRELAEFLFWLQDGEAYDSDTLTSKQKLWLQQVRNYALWGSKAKEARQAKKVLGSLESTRSDLQHFAFDIMVEKGIWDRHENLDLIRISDCIHRRFEG